MSSNFLPKFFGLKLIVLNIMVHTFSGTKYKVPAPLVPYKYNSVIKFWEFYNCITVESALNHICLVDFITEE